MKNSIHRKLWLASAALAIASLSACGGGGSDSSSASNVAIAPPAPTPTPSATPTPSQTTLSTCTGMEFLDVVGAASPQASVAGMTASAAIDDGLIAESRWDAAATAGELTLDLGGQFLVREVALAMYLGDQRSTSFSLEISQDGSTFTALQASQQSSGSTASFERFDVPDTQGRYVRITGTGTSDGSALGVVEAGVVGCSLSTAAAVPATPVAIDTSIFGLDPNVTPGGNFELIDWALDTPATDPGDGFAQRTQEGDLATFSDEFFFTASDGGMVFRSTIEGATTSANSSFTRSELREMLRAGNRSISTRGVNGNNWLLGYQPDPGVTTGGRGGSLKATLAINNVTSTGSDFHIGRFVIGQIHAENDEPIRLYYRKFPNNDRGYIYFAHEIRGGDDIYFVVVGPEDNDRDRQPDNQTDPLNGIALDEIFSYEINQAGSRIDVIIRRGDQDGAIIGHNFVDMAAENSGYDVIEEWNYFKAGSYTQNNTGSPTDFDMATFYRLDNSHN